MIGYVFTIDNECISCKSSTHNCIALWTTKTKSVRVRLKSKNY